MARLAITIAVLFVLFTFSAAHLQVYSPDENDVINHDDPSKSMPDAADSNPNILSPTDKSDQSSDESASVEIEAVDVNNLVQVTLPEQTTFVSFHPINRHFRMNNHFPLRHTCRRPCRHFVKPMNHRSRQISYGNDVILSNNENNVRDPELLFRDQIIPSVELRFQRKNHHYNHHGHQQNKFISKYVFTRDRLKRPARREDEVKEREIENGGKENGSFVKRIRKFLNHF